MKKLFFIFLFLSNYSVFGQTLSNYISQVDLNSVIKTVRELSGEDSSIIYGTSNIIKDRVSLRNELAFSYLIERLTKYGLDVKAQSFNDRGKNVIATQKGILHPDSVYIICAHYDAVTDYCADDNASGTAAVLEAARILSNECLDYTIIYALWDEEEQGLHGSNFFAKNARLDSQNILGVLNIEMLGYDGNNDGLFEIHTNSNPSSLKIGSVLNSLVINQKLSLKDTLINPGTTASDHASFWREGFAAVVISQGYYTGDFNPAYHTDYDRIDLFNIPYFEEMVKLSVGTISALASPCSNVHVSNSVKESLTLYPNPANLTLQIKGLGKASEFIINNHLGQKVSRGTLLQDQYLNVRSLASGLYFIQLDTGQTFKFLKQ